MSPNILKLCILFIFFAFNFLCSILISCHISIRLTQLNHDMESTNLAKINAEHSENYVEGRFIGSQPGDKTHKVKDLIEQTNLPLKIEQYLAKIRNDKILAKELQMYIEARVKIPDDTTGSWKSNHESFELVLDLKKNFLNDNSQEKVFLLTGQAGSGKTLFCKYLIHALMEEWSFEGEYGERGWLPIMIDLSKFRDRQQLAIVDTLVQELLLSEDEVMLFQNSKEKNIPHLLFIFDGYDELIQSPWLFNNEDRCIANNLYMLNEIGKKWKDAKSIVTCSKESLSDVYRRDLLFSPIDDATKIPMSELFLERELESFSDEEIRTYLKRSITLNRLSSHKIETEIESSSWQLIDFYIKTIENCELRELMSLPSSLSIISQLLPKILEIKQQLSSSEDNLKMSEKEAGEEETQTQIDPIKEREISLDYWFLCESFLEQFAKSAIQAYSEKNQTKESLLYDKIQQRLEYYALLSGGYSLSSSMIDPEKENDQIDEILQSSTPYLIFRKPTNRKLEFIDGFLRDFLIVKKIIKEVLEYSRETIEPKSFILNQRLLGRDSKIVKFLVTALKTKRISSECLLRLIESSRIYQKNGSQNPTEPLFAIAASNSMTILNTAGFSFSKLDLSNIAIPDADLRFGNFEDTNFQNCNLERVNFAFSSLKNTNFCGSRMKDTNFGFHNDLPLDSQVSSLLFSHTGKLLLTVQEKDMILYERDVEGYFFTAVRKFEGHTLNILACSFSPDAKQIVSGGEDKVVRVWDVESGKCIKELNGHTHAVTKCSFSPDKSKILSVDEDLIVNVWESETGVCIMDYQRSSKRGFYSFKMNEKRKIACKFSPVGGQILVGLDDESDCRLRAASGRCIRRYRGCTPAELRFLLNGKVIMSSNSGTMTLFDSVRGYRLKIIHNKLNEHLIHDSENFIIIGDKRILIKDAATSTSREILDRPLDDTEIQGNQKNDISKRYATHLDSKQVALFRKQFNVPLVSVYKIPPYSNLIRERGRQIDLNGTNIDLVTGLSHTQLCLFGQKSDYSAFPRKYMQYLIQGDVDHAALLQIDQPKSAMGNKAAMIIGRNVTWVNLQKLILRKNNFSDKVTEVIAANTSWTNLRILDLSKNLIENEGAMRIAQNTVWTSLEELWLSQNAIGAQGCNAIAMNTYWKKLKVLDLERNCIDSEGAISLGKNSTFSDLEVVNLGWNLIDSQGVEALSLNTSWLNLQTLNLAGNLIDANGAKILSQNISWTSLHTLNLAENILTSKGAAFLRDNKSWINLRALDLSNNSIDDGGAIELSSNASWPLLEKLNLQNNAITAVGMKELTRNSIWKGLKEVHVSNKNLTSKGRAELNEALMWNTGWINITNLNLQNCCIGDEGVANCVKNLKWSNLVYLNLSSNKITPQGAIELGRTTQWETLQSLNLADNTIRTEGAAGLSKNTSWKNLKSLNLQNNIILNDGLSELCKNTTWLNLTALNLAGNRIHDRGVLSLCTNSQWKKLESLFLDNNAIADQGAAELSKTTWNNLKTLSLLKNQIGLKGAKCLASSIIGLGLKVRNLELRSYSEVEFGIAKDNDDSEIPLENSINLGCVSSGLGEIFELTTSPKLNELHTLNLRNIELTDKDAISLSKSVTLTHLHTLNLSCNSIQDKGISEFAKVETWRNLEVLYLQNNMIGDQGIADLSKSLMLANVSILNLSNNSIRDKGVIELSQSAMLKNLQVLELEEDYIGEEGMTSLGENTSWVRLQQLNLKGCYFGAAGAEKLSKNTAWKNIEEMNLAWNKILDRGAEMLCQNSSWRKLKSLNLENNSISSRLEEKLKSNSNWPKLSNLSVNSANS